MKRPLDERFADWVDGRLNAAERAALEAEMARDPELRRAAEDYRQGVLLVRSVLPTADMGPSLADAVLARVRPAPARPPRAWRPLLASLVAAAALVLVFFTLRSIPPVHEPRQDVSARAVPDPSGAEVELDELVPSEEAASETGAPREAAPSAAPQPKAEARRAEAEMEAKDQENARAGARLLADAADAARPETKKDSVQSVAPNADRPAALEQRDAASDVRLSLGAVALVVEVAAPTDASVWRELEQRTAGGSATAAEILALLAPPLAAAAEDKRDAPVDFRRLPVLRFEGPDAGERARPKDGEDTPSREGTSAGGAEFALRGGGGRGSGLAVEPGDRLFRVQGTNEELTALTAALRARSSGQVHFGRVGAGEPAGKPPAGQAPGAPRSEDDQAAARGAAPQPQTTRTRAQAKGEREKKAAPDPAGRAEAEKLVDALPSDRGRGEAMNQREEWTGAAPERIEMLLILRPRERR